MNDEIIDAGVLAATPVHADGPPPRAPIVGAVALPIALLKPNRYNPRKRLDPKALDELVASVEKLGVIQPILVRPAPDHTPGDGGALYEIVAGERRWRALSKLHSARPAKTPGRRLADPPTIPALVRDLTDYEALELATVENLQRQDLHPIEEAEGFELLLHPPLQTKGAPAKALTLEELAAKIGKSASYVRKRLALLNLNDKAREAAFNGQIHTTIALLISRVPADRQAKALEDVQRGYGGEPMTYLQAQAHIHRCYMLELAGAVFKITDATLVPEAGSCRECPKRTGANPELFDDVTKADTCADPTCFEHKVQAHHARIRQQAEAAGQRIVDKPRAGEYMLLDSHDYNIASSKTIGQLLGKGSGIETVLVQTNDGLVPAVKTTEAKEALKANGLLKPKRNAAGDHQREYEERAKAGTAWRRAVAVQCLEHLQANDITAEQSLAIVRLAAEAHYCRMESDVTNRMHSLLGSKPIAASRYSNEGAAEVRAAVAAMTPQHLLLFCAAMAISTDLYLAPYRHDSKEEGSRLRELAALCGVDVDQVRATVLAERKAALKAKLAPKARADTDAANTGKRKRPGGNRRARVPKAPAAAS